MILYRVRMMERFEFGRWKPAAVSRSFLDILHLFILSNASTERSYRVVKIDQSEVFPTLLILVWNQSGINTQTIFLPCISIWCLDTLTNGDIAVGGNDGFIRIFTRSSERHAPIAEITAFDEAVVAQAIPTNQVGDVDKSKLPGIEALASPGVKNGQVLMVKSGNVVEAHQVKIILLMLKVGRVYRKVGENWRSCRCC